MNKYITLISSEDYFISGLVLNKTLRQVQSKYPLIIAITDNLATEKYLNILIEEEIAYVIIPQLKYAKPTGFGKRLDNTASKLALFDLNWDDKLIYIDSDTYIRKNIDELFEYPNGAALYSHLEKMGMSGLFVFIPKYHDYNIYKCLLNHLEKYLDGGIIGSIFFSAKENKEFQIPEEIYFSESLELNNKKIIHFHGDKKPFLLTENELLKYNKIPVYNLYFQSMLPLKIKYNL